LNILKIGSLTVAAVPHNSGKRCKKGGTNKKKTLLSSQAATDIVQKLRGEYWEKVKNIAPKNLVFLDEMGVLLGLSIKYARSAHGTPSM
jgi:hypothetical protein